LGDKLIRFRQRLAGRGEYPPVGGGPKDLELRAATRLVACQLPDRTVNVAVPGIEVQLCRLDGRACVLDRTVVALAVV
jgi:hypothetical protein